VARKIPRIFVVDDNDPVRWAIRLLSRSFGWQCEEFASAIDCLHALRHGAPDCLLLELDMPGMSGADLIEALRSENNPLPVIAMSGDPGSPLAVRARACGVVTMLAKPFGAEELESAVVGALPD
jgi:FixJ family two-component response regulator